MNFLKLIQFWKITAGKGYLLVYSLFHSYAPLIRESSKIAGVDMFPTDYCFQLKSLHFLRGAGQGGEWVGEQSHQALWKGGKGRSRGGGGSNRYTTLEYT